MTATRAEVEELIDLVTELPPFERAAPAEELVRTADALGEAELRFRARLTLVEAYHYVHERHRMFAPFVYVLQQYDDAPTWLTALDRHRVLWVHKWMVTLLAEHPQVPLTQLETALDGMRRRYVEAGEGLAPVLGCAYVLQAHLHGAAAARREFDAWRRAPRTELSDCEGCEPTTRIEHLAELGRHDEARDELGQVLRGDVGCSEQPHAAVAEALASLVELGDLDAAASLHRSAYRASRRNPAHTGSVARHLHLLARTGNLARGLDLLAEQVGAIEHPASPLAGMELAAAASRLLDAVVAAGDGDVAVRGPGRPPERAADMLVRVREHARVMAHRFDERNGTTAVGERLAWWLTAPDLPPVPLGPVGVPTSAAVLLPDVPEESDHPDLRGDADLAALDVRALAARADLAGARAAAPTWDRIAAHWTSRRADVLAGLRAAGVAEEAGRDAELRAAADLDAFTAWCAREPQPVLAASAADLYRRAGDAAEAALVELLDDLRAGRPADAAAVLAVVDADGTPGQRARVRARLAEDAGPERAAELTAAAAALLAAVPLVTPEDRHLAAALRLRDEGDAAGDGRLSAVVALLGDAEAPDVRVQVELERAAALAEDGDEVGALAEIDRAVVIAQRAGAPELVLQAETTRCRLLAATGDMQAAEARALAVASAALERELLDVAVDSRTLATYLMATHGREVEAVELAEATLALRFPPVAVPRGLRRHRAAQRLRLLDLAAGLSSSLDEQDRACALAREAVELAAGPDGDDAIAATALHRLAGLVAQDDAVEATRLFSRALDAAEATGQHALALLVRRERVAARFDADGLDAALADVADASRANEEAATRALTDPALADDLADWDEPLEQLTLATLTARLLVSAGEPERALQALDGLPERWEAVGEQGEALHADVLRGQALLGLGRADQGLAVLAATAESALGAGWPSLVQAAAGAGAAWLDDAGRPDDAQAFWARHVRLDDPTA